MSTFTNQKFTCPACGIEFDFPVAMSYSTWGQMLDGQPAGSANFPIEIPTCPECHFVFHKDFFTKDEVDLIKVKINIKDLYIKELMPCFYYYALEAQIAGKNEDIVMYNYLQATWATINDQQYFWIVVKKLAPLIENLLQVKELSDDQMTYVIFYRLILIELYRRIGYFDKALDCIASFRKEYEGVNTFKALIHLGELTEKYVEYFLHMEERLIIERNTSTQKMNTND